MNLKGLIPLFLITLFVGSALALSSNTFYMASFADLDDGVCGRIAGHGPNDCDNLPVFDASGTASCVDAAHSSNGKSGCLIWDGERGPSKYETQLYVPQITQQSFGEVEVSVHRFGGGTYEKEQAHVFVNGQYAGITPDDWCNYDGCPIDNDRHTVELDFARKVLVKPGVNDVVFVGAVDGGSFDLESYRLIDLRKRNKAVCEVINAPSTLIVGEEGTVQVKMRNTGSTIWTRAEDYKLANKGGINVPGHRVLLPSSVAVDNGDAYTFTFPIVAPSTPGAYRTNWQMVEEHVEFFGDKCESDIIKVIEAPNTPPKIGPLPDKSLAFNSGDNQNLFNLNDFAADAEDPDSALVYRILSETHPSVVDCRIDSADNIDCTVQSGQQGYSDITVEVEDTRGAKDQDTFRVTVLPPVNTPPTLSQIPTQLLDKDSGDNQNIVNLRDFGSDAEDTPAELQYIIVSESQPSIVDCSVDVNDRLDCNVKPGQTGTSHVTMKARDTDGLDSNLVTFKVKVLSEGTLVITDITCLDPVIVGDEQTCTITVEESNSPEAGVTVTLFKDDDLGNQLGACITTAQGTCNIGFGEFELGPQTVVATAVKSGFNPDDDYDPSFTYNVVSQNTPPVIAGLPNQNLDEDSGLNADLFDVNDFASDAQDPDFALTYDITSQTHEDIVTCSIGSDDKVDCTVLPDKVGSSDVTIRVTDTGGLTDEDTFRVTVHDVSEGDLEITVLTCFDPIMQGGEQVCSIFVEENGDPSPDAEVNLFYNDGTFIGTCDTNSISGGCTVNYIENGLGSFTVYATAHKPGYTSDSDKHPKFTYDSLYQRYDVEELLVFNDSLFLHEDYDFFRGQDMFVSFKIYDQLTSQYVGVSSDIVSKAALVSPPGGNVELDSVASVDPFEFRYELRPIPITHDFLGDSQVFAFAFNFSDSSAGQVSADVIIRNNPPKIIGTIPDQEVEEGETVTLDLTSYEFDIEDSGSDLVWTVTDVDGSVLTASVDAFTDVLSITGVLAGSDFITLTLFDLDLDSDSQLVHVNVVEPAPECNDGEDNDGDGWTDFPDDPGCSSPDDDDESDDPPQCQDGKDNDQDGLVDYPFDPGCTDPDDDDETDPSDVPECFDTIDNDGDGLVDFPADPGCDSAADDNEFDSTRNIKALIDANPPAGKVPLLVQFNGIRSQGAQPLSFSWDFDASDGIQVDSTLFNPGHIYTETGDYTVTLTVVDALGRTDTATAVVRVGLTDLLDRTNTAREHIFVSSERIINEEVNPGQTADIIVSFDNVAGKELKNVDVTASILELGTRRSIRADDRLRIGDEKTVIVPLDIPRDAAPGVYTVRIVISDNQVIKRVDFRDVWVQ